MQLFPSPKDSIMRGPGVGCTANIFNVVFTVFKRVPISTVISLYGLHLVVALSTVE